MKIRVGYELIYDCPQPTPMSMVLGSHFTRASDVITPDYLTTNPSVPISPYRDVFGNWCSRIVAPAGRVRLSADGVVRDSGIPDVVVPSAFQHAVEDLPPETLVFLLGSRYCETDRLSEVAWSLFQKSSPGWSRVRTICDFVHRHIEFGYEHARATMTSWEVFNEGKGVCRDYAHLAITFCRCMNIPARYCTGYLGDIGVPPPYGPMDLSAERLHGDDTTVPILAKGKDRNWPRLDLRPRRQAVRRQGPAGRVVLRLARSPRRAS